MGCWLCFRYFFSTLQRRALPDFSQSCKRVCRLVFPCSRKGARCLGFLWNRRGCLPGFLLVQRCAQFGASLNSQRCAPLGVSLKSQRHALSGAPLKEDEMGPRPASINARRGALSVIEPVFALNTRVCLCWNKMEKWAHRGVSIAFRLPLF